MKRIDCHSMEKKGTPNNKRSMISRIVRKYKSIKKAKLLSCSSRILVQSTQFRIAYYSSAQTNNEQ